MVVSGWVLDESKFLSMQEVKRLLRSAEARAGKVQRAAARTAARDSFVMNLALSTGLRVSEMANLRVGDIFIEDGMSSLIVRNGKGGKPRSAAFNGTSKEHLLQYLQWKRLSVITQNQPAIIS